MRESKSIELEEVQTSWSSVFVVKNIHLWWN